MKHLIDQLEQTRHLDENEWIALLEHAEDKDLAQYLFEKSRRITDQIYGKEVYIRGLIEFTNYCKNNCYYCGLRRDNRSVERYRLTQAEIMDCCKEGYALGFRTFVLQGGEDPYYTQERFCEIIASIRAAYPDCAITLSIGERSHAEYAAYYAAGANRFLLRHESADPDHYAKLHPAELTLAHRLDCLFDLKQIGFQTGTGFMVGSPYQTNAHLAKDLQLIEKLQPHMVGIGPFITNSNTPFKTFDNGSLNKTLFLIGLLRLLLPCALLPATTALGTIHPEGRERGILAGANVVMPNLSPLTHRKKYMLYDNKISTGDEAAESVMNLKKRMAGIGYQIVTARGDSKMNRD